METAQPSHDDDSVVPPPPDPGPPIALEDSPTRTTPLTWEELSALRWGPAEGDWTPGLVVDRPDPDRMRAAFAEADERVQQWLQRKKNGRPGRGT